MGVRGPNAFFLLLIISLLELLFKAAARCDNPRGSIGWMLSLIMQVTYCTLTNTSTEVQLKIFKFTDPQGVTLSCAEFNNTLTRQLKWKLSCLLGIGTGVQRASTNLSFSSEDWELNIKTFLINLHSNLHSHSGGLWASFVDVVYFLTSVRPGRIRLQQHFIL